MLNKDIVVGQIVRHSSGFIGEVVKENGTDVDIKIADARNTDYPVGYIYKGIKTYISEIIEEPAKRKAVELAIDVQLNGAEQVEELLEKVSEHEEATTVFKAKLGNDYEFEGTKSDFEVFIEGIERMFKLANLYNGVGKR